ncbi:uncharacterized protein LOC124168037 [Ischnura elegans]|uniref:uncharacterized protein LOC124168037 n=1 Tax=Ischnura elegans TaxID=197161 RepID=UPI001ED8973B|nr:uncharacterized protein LOC124168037 [Ischnura elegans]
MPDQADGGGEGSSSGDNKGGGGGDKKEEGGAGKHKKLLRLLTVMAYLSTVSGTAFMLSLYYLFLWTPKVQLGGKALVQDPPPPSSMALFFPEMAPHLAARVADEHEMSKASGPQWAARTQPRPTDGTRRKTKKGDDASESQVPATPQLALPAMKEAEAAFAARRREARSTIMDTTTPSSTSATHPTTPTTGRDAAHRGRTPTAPPPTPHRGAAKGGGEQWHSTPPPHPAEIAVHA